MKTLQLSILFVLACFIYSHAQVGIGTAVPDSKSILDLTSPTKGLLVPRMTEAARLAIPSPPNGMVVYQYDGDVPCFYIYVNGVWKNLCNANFQCFNYPPVATAASAVDADEFTANWESYPDPGILNYYLDVSTVSDFAPGYFVSGYENLDVDLVTSYPVTGLSSGTTYYYRIRAEKSCGMSEHSNTIVVSTDCTVPPLSPTNLSGSDPVQDGFTANWTPSAQSSGYYLDVSTDNFSTFIGSYLNYPITGGQTSSYVITGLTCNTAYQFRLRAYNNCGASSYATLSGSYSTLCCAPPIPTALEEIDPETDGFTARWTASTGATTYQLYVATDETFTNMVSGYNPKDAGLVTQYDVTPLACGQTYYYRVRAENACGLSAVSNTIAAATTCCSLSAPVANAATNPTPITFTASWSAVSGADSYQLDVATDLNNINTYVPGFQNRTVNGTSELVTGLSCGTTYYYRVRAYNICGSSANSNTITALTNTAPIAPNNHAGIDITQTSFTASWSQSAGATLYELTVATSSSFGSGDIIYTNNNVPGTSFPVGGLGCETDYYYRVVAKNSCGTSGYTTPYGYAQTLCCPPEVPEALAATNIGDISFRANWEDVGAPSYILRVATDPDLANPLPGLEGVTVNGLYYDVANLNCGTYYYYKVRATSVNCGNSDWSPVAQAVMTTGSAPAQPSEITGPPNPCQNTAGLSYAVTNVPGVTYTWTVPAGWSITAGQGSNSITVTSGIAAGNVSVTPENTCSQGTARTKAVSTTAVPAQPGSISGNSAPCVSTSNLVYSISPVAGATSYSWSVPSGWSITQGSGTTSITVTSGTSSGNIQVYANNACGSSLFPATLGVTPISLPGSAGTITGSANVCQGETSVSYSVPAITNATGYVWNYSGTGLSITAGSNTNAITASFSASATSGSLTVYGTNSCGSGTTSAGYSITVGELPSAPTAGTHVPSQTQIVWNWNAVSGATDYKWNTVNNFSTAVSTSGATTKTQTGLDCNTSYTCYVWAINNCGNSGATTLTQTTSACGASYPPGTINCITGGSAVVDVTNPTTGKVWMDRNLGASQVATSSTDALAYGDLYQWGRFSDGHQCRNSTTTSTNATTSVPNLGNPWDGKFITENSSPYDWLTPQNNNLWQGVSGTNNPCPSGYRLPTEAEWNAERLSWSSNNAGGAFASPLKLPVAGYRFGSSGALISVGNSGGYWSSTVDGTRSRCLYFSSGDAYMSSTNRALGFSVRCLKD